MLEMFVMISVLSLWRYPRTAPCTGVKLERQPVVFASCSLAWFRILLLACRATTSTYAITIYRLLHTKNYNIVVCDKE